MKTIEPAKGFEKPLIEEGMYNAVFVEARDIPPHEKFGERYALIFNVQGPGGKNVELSQIAYKAMTTKSKLGIALKAFGADIEKAVDIDAFKGTECRVFVETYELKDGKKASAIEKVKPKVEQEKIA